MPEAPYESAVIEVVGEPGSPCLHRRMEIEAMKVFSRYLIAATTFLMPMTTAVAQQEDDIEILAAALDRMVQLRQIPGPPAVVLDDRVRCLSRTTKCQNKFRRVRNAAKTRYLTQRHGARVRPSNAADSTRWLAVGEMSVAFDDPEVSGDSASVRVMVTEVLAEDHSFLKIVRLILVRTDDEWKVVRDILELIT